MLRCGEPDQGDNTGVLKYSAKSSTYHDDPSFNAEMAFALIRMLWMYQRQWLPCYKRLRVNEFKHETSNAPSLTIGRILEEQPSLVTEGRRQKVLCLNT